MSENKKSFPLGALTGLILIATFAIGGSFLDLERTAVSTGIDLKDLPKKIGHWEQSSSLEMKSSSRDTLQLSSYVKRHYSRPDGASVYLYAGHWDKQSGEHQAAKHSPVTCLPANGWSITSPKRIDVEGIDFQVNRLSGSVGKTTSLVYYWFYTASETYLQEWKALIKISMGNLFHGRSDGGIVEMSVSYGNGKTEQKADEILADFTAALSPEMQKLIKKSDS